MKDLGLRLRVLSDTRGQAIGRYALVAGFIAVAAGAMMPDVSASIHTIFSQLASVVTRAASQGN
jgi:Flp pilus assembly pilin Flp